MNRAKRLEPVQRIADDNERRCAERFAAAERRVGECKAKLEELERYRADYEKGFITRASAGLGALGLRDYQAFLAKLTEAVKQQTAILQRSQSDRDMERLRWQDAAKRVKAMGHVVEGWKAQERRVVERQEQRDTDERALRRTPTDALK